MAEEKQQGRICILGLWHQGVVAAACLADLGYDVLAADPDEERVRLLAEGKPLLFEPGLEEVLGKTLGEGRLSFTADLGAAVRGRRDVLIMFDTPVDENDQSDLSVIFETAARIAPHLEEDTVILVTAQVPVGTCDQIARLIREENPQARFGIAYMPENLRLGQAIDRFVNPPLPVIGADDEATLDRVERLLSVLVVNRFERVGLRTAEMTKHALNAFLATCITFGNELGNICDEVGADAQRVAEVLRLEPRVGSKAMLFPGLGFSGGTLARDMQTLRGLAGRTGLYSPLLDGVWEANSKQNELVVRKLRKIFGRLEDVRVAVLGLTYKPETSTLRRSAALEIIADMDARGAKVTAHDPKADREELARHTEFEFREDVYDAVEDAQAVVVITGWAEYKELDFGRIREAMSGDVLIDCNNMLDAEKLIGLGFTYLDVGRGRGAGTETTDHGPRATSS